MWIFGYGSLMWHPEFEPAERRIARLPGYSRSFCMWSIHHRGTVEDPGLVLALDEDAEVAPCLGLALKIPEEGHDDIVAQIRERELISSAYVEQTVRLETDSGPLEDVLAYVINRDHEQYCKHLTLEDQAQIIAQAVGGRGPNDEYLYNTVTNLRELGITDEDMEWLDARVRALKAAQ